MVDEDGRQTTDGSPSCHRRRRLPRCHCDGLRSATTGLARHEQSVVSVAHRRLRFQEVAADVRSCRDADPSDHVGHSILGHHIPAGAGTALDVHLPTRLQTWWPRPDVFDPGRFDDPAVLKVMHRDPRAVPPLLDLGTVGGYGVTGTNNG